MPAHFLSEGNEDHLINQRVSNASFLGFFRPIDFDGNRIVIL
jgi:hypothetical protein